MQRAMPWLHRYSRRLLGLLGELQETTPTHDVREEHEQALIGKEYFASQDETQ